MKTVNMKFRTLFVLLLLGSMFTSCSSDDDVVDDSGDPNPPQDNDQAIS